MKGKHLIADIYNINNVELLSTVEGVKPLLDMIVKIGKLNVLGEIKHQFQPKGATILYLLSESHLSIHTYPEKNYVAIDLYCCNPLIDMVEILEIIYNYFNRNCIIVKKIIDR